MEIEDEEGKEHYEGPEIKIGDQVKSPNIFCGFYKDMFLTVTKIDKARLTCLKDGIPQICDDYDITALKRDGVVIWDEAGNFKKENKMEKISKSYNYHKPSEEGLAKVKAIREAFTALDALVSELAPSSRERSLAITELETAAMWAIKAVVINDPESVVE